MNLKRWWWRLTRGGSAGQIVDRIILSNDEIFDILKREAASRLKLSGDVYADSILTTHPKPDGKSATYTFTLKVKQAPAAPRRQG